MNPKTKYEVEPDLAAIVGMEVWLEVLAAPHIYRSLDRPVDPQVLLELLDVWIARGERLARDGERESCPTPPYRRYDAVLARKLRALVASWTPPDLPAEIVEAARAMLHALGLREAHGGGRWDDYTPDNPQWQVAKTSLVWSEGVDAILPKKT